METTFKKGQKLVGKTQKKFLHKLNKQQTELWRQVTNLYANTFLKESFDGDSVKERKSKFSMKMQRKLSINQTSSK